MPSSPPPIPVAERLSALRKAGLLQRMRTVESAPGPTVELDGRRVLQLCSDDYLGLAGHPTVADAAIDAVERWGTGAGSSRLAAGNVAPHERLERRLAELHGTEASLLFGSGYLANTGIVAALARRGDVVFSDELNEASIADGCRLAGALTFVYRHRDLEHLAWGLERTPGHAGLIVSDGLFPHDGDVAQLGWLRELANRHGAKLMVDDSHAVGAIGPGGRGSVAEAGLTGQVDVLVGALGNALGSYGAYACTSREIRELLISSSRTMLFCHALPPACAAAAEAALGVMDAEPGLITALRENARSLRTALASAGLEPGGAGTQIVPVAVGDPDRAVAASRRALDDGVYVQALRPPAVPHGTSRLRLTAMASHDEADLVAAADTIAASLRAVSASGEWSIDLPDPGPGEVHAERAGQAGPAPSQATPAAS